VGSSYRFMLRVSMGCRAASRSNSVFISGVSNEPKFRATHTQWQRIRGDRNKTVLRIRIGFNVKSGPGFWVNADWDAVPHLYLDF
jgi:hypothetical protein